MNEPATLAQCSAVPYARPSLGEEECAAVMRVLRSGYLSQGPEVAAFEDEFAAAVDAGHAVAVSSGTAALELALRATGIGPGDEVIVPAFTFIATAAVACRLGADVRFADVDLGTFCVTRESIRAKLSARTKAVVPVHLFGYPAPIQDIAAALPQGVRLIEDAAQAHGAVGQSGHPVGASGTATFSFYPTKNVAVGEGGMVVTDDAHIAERIRLLRNHGMVSQYEYALVGGNERMTDLEAAIGRVQLSRLPAFLDRRMEIADRYASGLRGVRVPRVPRSGRHAWSCFTVTAPERDRLQARLSSAGIASKVFYPQALNTLDLFGPQVPCLNAERLAREVLSLPIRPDLTDADLDRVIETVNGTS
jgi:dTDP-4-amino-4,6-dideoxygalactose transaminase